MTVKNAFVRTRDKALFILGLKSRRLSLHGESEQEALDNLMDALELCLEHEREWPARKGQAKTGLAV